MIKVENLSKKYGDLVVLKNISTEILRQLPSVWRSKSIEVISKIVKPFVHRSAKTKFLRWSRELMLIGYGEK